jgi:hypothetical protein
MGLTELFTRNLNRARRGEIQELVFEGGYELYSASWRLGKLLPIDETNIFDRDWDVLVILDGCRVDLMHEVKSEYEFLSNISEITSTGSMSLEWMENTFSNAPSQELASTAYVTSNLFSRDVCDDEMFSCLEEVWRYGWDDELNTIPARPVTDKAIDVMRSESPERMIVHYMQPHHPFIGENESLPSFNPDPFGRDNDGIAEARTAWDALRRGELTYEAVWQAYKENLRYVLEDVSILRKNIRADKLAITADHGNAVGEWGIYDHPIGFPHPAVKNVPWVETTAKDEHTYEPSITEQTSSKSIDERLSALGYK